MLEYEWCCSDKKWLHLLNIYHKFKPNVICLLETMVDSETVYKYGHHLSFDLWYFVPPVGKSGGLALGYFANSNIEIIGSAFNMIHIL